MTEPVPDKTPENSLTPAVSKTKVLPVAKEIAPVPDDVTPAADRVSDLLVGILSAAATSIVDVSEDWE